MNNTSFKSHPLVFMMVGLAACGTSTGVGDESDVYLASCDDVTEPSTTISCVESFNPGEGSGFGMDTFPEIIFGPPEGAGVSSGGLNVLSLGQNGSIVLGFGSNNIVDGEGADFIVFENAFYIDNNPQTPFAELAMVSVSEDGQNWTSFSCNNEEYPFTGCAGWNAVISSSENGISPYNPDEAGGEAFDLSTIGLTTARYIQIRDIAGGGSGTSVGFDLDAIALIHTEEVIR